MGHRRYSDKNVKQGFVSGALTAAFWGWALWPIWPVVVGGIAATHTVLVLSEKANEAEKKWKSKQKAKKAGPVNTIPTTVIAISKSGDKQWERITKRWDDEYKGGIISSGGVFSKVIIEATDTITGVCSTHFIQQVSYTSLPEDDQWNISDGDMAKYIVSIHLALTTNPNATITIVSEGIDKDCKLMRRILQSMMHCVSYKEKLSTAHHIIANAPAEETDELFFENNP